jgi:hypothetical protein
LYFLLFDYSEIGEILHLQHNRGVVLVSYHESVIQGVNYRLGLFWDVAVEIKKRAVSPPEFVVFSRRKCQFQASGRLGGGNDS